MSDDTGQQTSLDEVVDKHMSKHKEQDKNTKDGEELFGIGKIPSDWKVVEMDDCVEIIPGNSPPSSTYNDAGDGLPFFQGNAEFGHLYPDADTWCSDPRKVAEEMDILMSIRAPVGDLNIADKKCCIGRGLAGLRPIEINGLYLFYFLAQREAWLSRLATGSTFKSVTKSDLQRLDIASPPLIEQRKIASVLYNVDKAIQKTNEIIDQLNVVESGLFQDLFSGEHLSCETQEVPPLGEIPSHWDVCAMGESCEITMGTSPKSEYYNETGDGLPFFQANNEFGERTPTHDRWCSNPVKTATENDVLMTIRGTYVGQVNIADRECCIGRGLAGISNSNQHTSEFLYHHLRERERYVKSIAIGSTFDSVSSDELENLDIVVPPIEEQKEIAETLRTLQKQVIEARVYREQIKRLKQGLMQDLLSGSIRTVNRDIEVTTEVQKHD